MGCDWGEYTGTSNEIVMFFSSVGWWYLGICRVCVFFNSLHVFYKYSFISAQYLIAVFPESFNRHTKLFSFRSFRLRVPLEQSFLTSASGL